MPLLFSLFVCLFVCLFHSPNLPPLLSLLSLNLFTPSNSPLHFLALLSYNVYAFITLHTTGWNSTLMRVLLRRSKSMYMLSQVFVSEPWCSQASPPIAFLPGPKEEWRYCVEKESRDNRRKGEWVGNIFLVVLFILLILSLSLSRSCYGFHNPVIPLDWRTWVPGTFGAAVSHRSCCC